MGVGNTAYCLVYLSTNSAWAVAGTGYADVVDTALDKRVYLVYWRRATVENIPASLIFLCLGGNMCR